MQVTADSVRGQSGQMGKSRIGTPIATGGSRGESNHVEIGSCHRLQRLIMELWVARGLGARGDRGEQDIRSSEYFDRWHIARTSVSDSNLHITGLVGRH